MNKNSLLEKLNGATIAVARTTSEPLWTHITRILESNWAKILYFIPWDDTSPTIPDNTIVIAPSRLDLPQIPAWQVLRWKLWDNEQEGLDIDRTSPNDFALRVAELINESKFKLPEWFQGYNFKWEWSVMEHPITKESCRKIRLFKRFDEWNIIETYAQIYLDEAGNLFNAVSKIPSFESWMNMFLPRNPITVRTLITDVSEINIWNDYLQWPVGERNPENKSISFFKDATI